MRHYNSDLSIWLSVDPMSDKYPSTSPYTYCGNNPVVLKDPNGSTYFEVEGEKKHINDGHDNITMLNVTEKQFNKLQRNFDKGHTHRYNTLHNRFKNHNGYIENTIIYWLTYVIAGFVTATISTLLWINHNNN